MVKAVSGTLPNPRVKLNFTLAPFSTRALPQDGRYVKFRALQW